MIQRIQTVYLLLAVIALGVMFFFPLAEFIGGDDQLIYYLHEVVSLVPGSAVNLPVYFPYPILGLTTITLILALYAIFQYKSRLLQLKLVSIGVVLTLLSIGVFFFYCIPLLEDASGVLLDWTRLKWISALPVALIFMVLAYRGILADEKLIRSADRLR